MTTVFVHHRVADYNTWRPEYDRVMTADWSKDIRAHQVWRGQDDPKSGHCREHLRFAARRRGRHE